MAAIQAHGTGDPRVSPALSSHLERHRRTHGLLPGGRDAATGLSAGLVPALVGARRLTGLVLDWPTRSQRRALRNAMLASTVLVERRIERDEVESFLREREAAQRSADQA